MTSIVKTPLPRVVWVLSGVTFLLGMSEFMVAGLLPEISRALHVSVSTAGLLASAFAVGMIFGAPAMAVATVRLPRRATLIVSLVLFSAGHAVTALSDSFTLAALSRVFAAVATGAFWATASVVVTTATGPRASGKALGLLATGLTFANVVGVPIGTAVAHAVSWRMPFWFLSVASLLMIVPVWRAVGHDERHEPQSLELEFAAMRNRRLWLVLATIVLSYGGLIASYSYITPLLTQRAGIAVAAVPLVLVAFGLGALAGSTYGGHLGDHRPLGAVTYASVGIGVVLVAIAFFATSPIAAVPLVFLMGFCGFTLTPPLSALVNRLASGTPTLPMAFAVASYNVGIAGGTWLASLCLDSSLRAKGPSLIGSVLEVAVMAPLLALFRMQNSGHLTGRIVEPGTGLLEPKLDVEPAQ